MNQIRNNFYNLVLGAVDLTQINLLPKSKTSG